MSNFKRKMMIQAKLLLAIGLAFFVLAVAFALLRRWLFVGGSIACGLIVVGSAARLNKELVKLKEP